MLSYSPLHLDMHDKHVHIMRVHRIWHSCKIALPRAGCPPVSHHGLRSRLGQLPTSLVKLSTPLPSLPLASPLLPSPSLSFTPSLLRFSLLLLSAMYTVSDYLFAHVYIHDMFLTVIHSNLCTMSYFIMSSKIRHPKLCIYNASNTYVCLQCCQRSDTTRYVFYNVFNDPKRAIFS